MTVPNSDLELKLAIYGHFADTGMAPTPDEMATSTGLSRTQVVQAYGRLRQQRVLVLDPTGESIRMAPPFSGVETPHRVTARGVSYFANCAWDALGIPAALHADAVVESRCENSGEPLRLRVNERGPDASAWLFHCLVPASKWWADIVFT
jgi:hypothetical protein